jgi:hypothetical protein
VSLASDIIAAVVPTLTVLGGAGAFVWNKLEKRFGRIEQELDNCHQRERRAQQQHAVHIAVIELMWREIERFGEASAPTLRRVKKLLDDMKALSRQDGDT